MTLVNEGLASSCVRMDSNTAELLVVDVVGVDAEPTIGGGYVRGSFASCRNYQADLGELKQGRKGPT